eukprot:SAG11_NODE_382_length_9923_cov_29.276771_6_plen_41_part_00
MRYGCIWLRFKVRVDGHVFKFMYKQELNLVLCTYWHRGVR